MIVPSSLAVSRVYCTVQLQTLRFGSSALSSTTRSLRTHKTGDGCLPSRSCQSYDFAVSLWAIPSRTTSKASQVLKVLEYEMLCSSDSGNHYVQLDALIELSLDCRMHWESSKPSHTHAQASWILRKRHLRIPRKYCFALSWLDSWTIALRWVIENKYAEQFGGRSLLGKVQRASTSIWT